MTAGAERVEAFLKSQGLKVELREFDTSTKSSSLAAQALGCGVGEIAKSVVFQGETPIVVVISGDRRVDLQKLAHVVGSRVEMATPEFVREATGYPIGGVPPFPHNGGVRVLPDVSLTRFRWVWAAGGAPNVVFRVSTPQLFKTVGTGPVDVSA